MCNTKAPAKRRKPKAVIVGMEQMTSLFCFFSQPRFPRTTVLSLVPSADTTGSNIIRIMEIKVF